MPVVHADLLDECLQESLERCRVAVFERFAEPVAPLVEFCCGRRVGWPVEGVGDGGMSGAELAGAVVQAADASGARVLGELAGLEGGEVAVEGDIDLGELGVDGGQLLLAAVVVVS